MQIDERALNFIQKAKAAGFSQQEVYDELVAKGYEVGGKLPSRKKALILRWIK